MPPAWKWTDWFCGGACCDCGACCCGRDDEMAEALERGHNMTNGIRIKR
jgi:hypothetical protein